MTSEGVYVVASGTPGTGKTTLFREVVKRIPNSFLLSKDGINAACLHVKPTTNGKLPSFPSYIQGDDSSQYCNLVDTPMGPMFRIEKVTNEFYGRHARDQLYLIWATIMTENLGMGKAPILESIPVRWVQDGTVQKFMEQECFAPYKGRLIHVTADEDELWHRMQERARIAQGSDLAGQLEKMKISTYTSHISSRDAFHDFATRAQPLVPAELQRYEHLLLNTSRNTLEENVQRVLDYISQ